MHRSKQPAQTMETAKSTTLWRRLVQGTCLRYTVITLASLLVGLLMGGIETNAFVDPLRLFLFLPFSLALTTATEIRKAPRLPTGARITLHPLCTLGGFYLFCYLPYQITGKPTGRQVLMMLLLAAVVYGVVMGIFLACTRRARQKKIDESTYTSQFGQS